MTSRTRDKWLSIIRRFEASSLTLRQFALTEELNYSTFRNYYYRLRHLCEDPAQSFLPVLIQGQPSAQAPLSLTVSDSFSLVFAELPPPAYLAQLLTSLKGL